MTDQEADPELRDGPRSDLHSLRARDAALDALSDEIQRSAAARAAADFGENSADMALLRSVLGEKAVLVTGSAGYLGFALYLTLQKLGVAVLGVDVVAGETVDVVADVADAEAMRRCGQACGERRCDRGPVGARRAARLAEVGDVVGRDEVRVDVAE